MLKRLGKIIFKFYCHPDYQEDILGDLEEYYDFHVEEKGERYASLKYLLDSLRLFRVSLLKDNWFTQKLIYTTMVKNNFKMAYRSLIRQKFYSSINIVGLALSMAACIFIAMYVKDEMSYDTHFEDSERIFRVANYIKFADNEFNLPTAPDPFAKTVEQDFPEVEVAGRFRGNSTLSLKIGDSYFNQSKVTWADQKWLDIFRFEVLFGDKDHLLDEPNTVVLEQTTARKLFGEENPVGKTLLVEGETEMKVTGVIADIPSNSHFDFDMFISMLNLEEARQNFWLSNNFFTYVKLQTPEQKAVFEEKIPEFLIRHVGPQVQRFMGASLEEGMKAGMLDLEYFLQPIEDIHLKSNLEQELSENGSIEYVYMFSLIGSFILLIACINFMNMATARAAIRAKEVGVRKVLGSLRKQLINQFLFESILNSVLAMILAIIIAQVFLPAFNQFTGKLLTNPIFEWNGMWPYLLAGTLLIGVLAGIYPAFVLSSFKPVSVLKGEVTKGKKSSWLRNGLVVVQFATSIFLIIGSIFVYGQLSYLQNKELGFNKDQILVIQETQVLGDQINSFKEELLRNPLIENVSISDHLPATDSQNDFPILTEEATSPEEAVSMQIWYVDHDYADTYDLEFVKGRFYNRDIVSDSTGVVLNEVAIKRLGYDVETAVGKRVKTLGGVVGNETQYYTIVGVMKDFHFKSMTTEIGPHCILLGERIGAISVKFKPEAASETISIVQDQWNAFAEGLPFQYQFLDQIFNNLFNQQQRVKTIFTVFAFLAIVIAGLGLFALAAYVTEQRKKEIGIRKVLGASNSTILNLLFSNFTKLILISAVIAIPLVWWYVSDWLSAFPFRISMNPFFFAIGTIGVIIIAWLTVGYQSFRAVQRNPVENLRSE